MTGALRAAYPWKLRIEHEGFASLRLERAGRWFRFDPLEPPGDDVAVITWGEHDRLTGVEAAVEQGKRPTVVGRPEVLAWLGERGAVAAQTPPCSLDDVGIEVLDYEPIPYAAGMEVLHKLRSASRHPARAAGRLARRAALPGGRPVAVQLRFPGGERLVHLNMALHRATPEDWIEAALDRFRGADWLVAGVDHGEGEAALRHLPRFEARVVLVADLVGDVRRAIGLPAELLTPLVDRLREKGKADAYVMASRTSFRFE